MKYKTTITLLNEPVPVVISYILDDEGYPVIDDAEFDTNIPIPIPVNYTALENEFSEAIRHYHYSRQWRDERMGMRAADAPQPGQAQGGW